MFWFHYAFENVIIILEFLFKVTVVRIKWWTCRKDGKKDHKSWKIRRQNNHVVLTAFFKHYFRLFASNENNEKIFKYL